MFLPSSDSTVVMVGDAVKLAGDGRAATGVPTITRCSGATDVPVGVVVGIAFEGVGDLGNIPPVTDLNTPVYRRASTDRYVYVCTDPNAVYEAQWASTSQSAATVTAAIGNNAQLDVTAGSTTTGASGMGVGATVTTTATLPLKIVGVTNRPDNIPGDTYISFLVKLNNTSYGSGTGSTGV
jgi:hypothetical protein